MVGLGKWLLKEGTEGKWSACLVGYLCGGGDGAGEV